MLQLVSWLFDKLFAPFFLEKLRTTRLRSQLSLGKRLISSNSEWQIEFGMGMLFELAESYDYAKQEVINLICEHLRQRYPVTAETPRDGAQFASVLSRLSQLRRLDCNGHPYYFPLFRLGLAGVELTNFNLAHFAFYGSTFRRVQFHRAVLANAILDGVYFDECSLEFVDFTNARLGPCGEQDGYRKPRFVDCELYRSSIENADFMPPVEIRGSKGIDESRLIAISRRPRGA